MTKINPEVQQQYIQIYSKTIDQETSERLTKLITTGIEGYYRTNEKIVVYRLEKYIEQQNHFKGN
jgi:hypothetical protein